MAGRLYGRFLLQLGSCGPVVPELSFEGMRRHIIVDTLSGSRFDVAGDSVRLPIATSSVNAVYLPHVMEFTPDPHGLLREVDRTLIPDGRLLIFLFNPFSLYGLWRLLPRSSGSYPWAGDFISLRRIIDWLRLLGFDVEEIVRLGYRPPLQNQRLFDRFQPMERLAGRFWPEFSAVSMVLAIKREVPLSLIRPVWQKGRRFIPSNGVTEPTSRDDCCD